MICSNVWQDWNMLDTDVAEIKALLGILNMAGVLKSWHTNLPELWKSDTTVADFFHLVISNNPFYLLLMAIHFDFQTRTE